MRKTVGLEGWVGPLNPGKCLSWRVYNTVPLVGKHKNIPQKLLNQGVFFGGAVRIFPGSSQLHIGRELSGVGIDITHDRQHIAPQWCLFPPSILSPCVCLKKPIFYSLSTNLDCFEEARSVHFPLLAVMRFFLNPFNVISEELQKTLGRRMVARRIILSLIERSVCVTWRGVEMAKIL